jgi:hypothetical protein
VAKEVARTGQPRHNHKRNFYGYGYGCHKSGQFMADLHRTINFRHKQKRTIGLIFIRLWRFTGERKGQRGNGEKLRRRTEAAPQGRIVGK